MSLEQCTVSKSLCMSVGEIVNIKVNIKNAEVVSFLWSSTGILFLNTATVLYKFS